MQFGWAASSTVAVLALVVAACSSETNDPELQPADETTVSEAQTAVESGARKPILTAETVDGRDFGLIGDGITINTAAFRELMGAGYRTIRIPKGDYVTGSFQIAANTIVELEAGTIIRDSGELSLHEPLISILSDNVRVTGLGSRVIANRSHYLEGQQRHGVFIFGAHNVVIDGLESSHHGGDGFYIGGPRGNPSTDIVLTACRSADNRRQGLSITSARRVHIADCEFRGTNGTAPEFGIDLEPNEAIDALDGITFLRPQTIGNRGGGILIELENLDATSEPVDVVIIDHFSTQEDRPLLLNVGTRTDSIRYNRQR